MGCGDSRPERSLAAPSRREPRVAELVPGGGDRTGDPAHVRARDPHLPAARPAGGPSAVVGSPGRAGCLRPYGAPIAHERGRRMNGTIDAYDGIRRDALHRI